ncbi:hypothetical protein JYU14_02690 [Simkania negevensis]|uniref:Secreted protein n=1 Tax=Simkania negevensis TaxID=83561 RepID=A0ABS3AQG6_9BACT|nr:hypothetical protein [Simkania negevensis]
MRTFIFSVVLALSSFSTMMSYALSCEKLKMYAAQLNEASEMIAGILHDSDPPAVEKMLSVANSMDRLIQSCGQVSSDKLCAKLRPLQEEYLENLPNLEGYGGMPGTFKLARLASQGIITECSL